MCNTCLKACMKNKSCNNPVCGVSGNGLVSRYKYSEKEMS